MKKYFLNTWRKFNSNNPQGIEGPPTAPENWCCPNCGTWSSGDKCPKCGYAG